MNFLGSNLNRHAFARAVPTNLTTSTPRTGDLRNAFHDLVWKYKSDGKSPELSGLVCECMKHGKVGVLREILQFQGMRSLSIQGPMNAQEWRTFVDAMPLPHRFPVAVLTLSNLAFDRSTVELLFQALGNMPALSNLLLFGVEAEAGVADAFGMPALANLKTLNVLEAGFGEPGVQGGKVSVCPLLIKILEGEDCRLQSLSIRGLRFEVPGKGNRKLDGPVVTVDQNARLGQALCRQPELRVLRITACHALTHFQDGRFSMHYPEDSGHLVQITPVYEMPSLRLLDLSGNLLSGSQTALILDALGKDGSGLQHLNLNGNFIGNATFAAMVSLLAKKNALVSASFLHVGLDVFGGNAKFLVGEAELEQLTEAVKDNTSLRRLSFEAVSGLDCSALSACLERNRLAFRTSTLQAGLRAVLRPIPNDVVESFAHQAAGYLNLSDRDALNVSSVDKAARAARPPLL